MPKKWPLCTPDNIQTQWFFDMGISAGFGSKQQSSKRLPLIWPSICIPVVGRIVENLTYSSVNSVNLDGPADRHPGCPVNDVIKADHVAARTATATDVKSADQCGHCGSLDATTDVIKCRSTWAASSRSEWPQPWTS